MKPHMSLQEINLLDKYTSECNNYFEFGVGGSTVHIYRNTKAIIRGVDSSKIWLSSVRKLVDRDRVSLKYVDIGPVGDWGRPVDYEFKHKWSDYYTSIHRTDIEPDFILVDGRFRVCCILQSILFSIKKDIDPVISLHDDWRPRYKHGIDYLECIDKSDNLSMYKIPKDRIDVDMINSTIDEFKYKQSHLD